MLPVVNLPRLAAHCAASSVTASFKKSRREDTFIFCISISLLCKISIQNGKEHVKVRYKKIVNNDQFAEYILQLIKKASSFSTSGRANA